MRNMKTKKNPLNKEDKNQLTIVRIESFNYNYFHIKLKNSKKKKTASIIQFYPIYSTRNRTHFLKNN